ncbi:MAG: class I SAM-dependent methyltransferase [Candidatus Methanosuratincola sp.]
MVNLQSLCHSKARVRFLDVGCGLGFAVSMARFLGWDAIGVEPGPIGQVGRELLGIEVASAYLEDTGFPDASFDIILSSEVIEHVPQPENFLRLLRKYIKPDGILCLTTPNAAAYSRESDGVKLEIISPGAHVSILSPGAMRQLLRQVGFRDYTVRFSEGTTGKSRMVVFASPQKSGARMLKYVKTVDPECTEFQRRYLNYVVDSRRDGCRDCLYDGMLYRLVENYTNSGKLEHAGELCQRLDQSVREKYGEFDSEFISNLLAKVRSGRIQSYTKYIAGIPSFLSRYLYYKGMICLNHTKDFSAAEDYFKNAYDLFLCERDIFRFYANWDMACQARYHLALAKLYAGEQKEALAVLGQMLSDRKSIPKKLLPYLHYSCGVAHLQVGDNVAALRSFICTFWGWCRLAFVKQVAKLVLLALRQEFRALMAR